MSPVIINPGSGGVAAQGDGWANTAEGAQREAQEWLERIHAEGMTDVELLPEVTESGGRWTFSFRHQITGTVVTLETHGIDNLDAYRKEHIFAPFGPRVYWRGDSSAEPKLEDFAAQGFVAVRTFRPAQSAKDYAATHPIVCAHADEDGGGSHILAPGEKCERGRQ